MIIRLFPLILIVTALTACSSVNELSMIEYNAEPQRRMPPVTVFLKRPSDEFRQDCEDFDKRSLLHHCQMHMVALEKLHQEFQNSGAFESVLYANNDTDYRLLITTARYNFEGGDDLGSAVLAGATLMLAPMVVSMDIKVNVGLYWHGVELDTFEYEIPFKQRLSLLTANQDHEADIARSVSSHILHDLQARPQLFEPSYLARKLEATDYENSLRTPLDVGDYRRDFLYVFNHPFRGAQVRYVHPTNPDDYADLFIYPVRSAHWQRPAELLEREAANVRKEMELVGRENGQGGPTFGADQPLRWELGTGELGLRYFEAEFTDPLENGYVSRTYLAIVEDKFFKVRHTAPLGQSDREEADRVVMGLLKTIQVPSESLFMAKIRRQWRDSGQL